MPNTVYLVWAYRNHNWEVAYTTHGRYLAISEACFLGETVAVRVKSVPASAGFTLDHLKEREYG